MTNLQLATDRIRRVESGETLETVYGGDRDSQFNRVYADQRVLYLAYLQEHPGDENELITEEWMAMASVEAISVKRDSLGLTVSIVFSPSSEWWSDLPRLPTCLTRGDLRRLCKVLGIELKNT